MRRKKQVYETVSIIRSTSYFRVSQMKGRLHAMAHSVGSMYICMYIIQTANGALLVSAPTLTQLKC